jgi:RNA polymerase sigma factor for flagellar operon FliA
LFERAPATILTSAGASDVPGAGPDRVQIEARVTALLPLVRHVVADVAVRLPRFVDRDELIAAGLLGLTQAAHSYDAARGVSFPAFARLRIKGAVLDELRGRDPLSRGARRRANQVHAAAAVLQEALGRPPTDAETAEHLGIDTGTVRQARDDVARAAQLERSTGDVDSGDATERADGGEGGPLAELLDAELRGYLMDAVSVLPERLRAIVVAHFFDGREMQDIAAELGVTASRVSQLCGRAVALLRDGLNAQLDPERVGDLAETTSRIGRRKHAYYQLVAGCSTTSDRLARGRALTHPAATVPARVAARAAGRVAAPVAA